ncbi:YigZ family protein [Streptococcus hongkongensis]|nr:Xaa-Pro dipeptidase [Streptococcus uberis]
MESYKTIENDYQFEEIIKKSRFICHLFKIHSEEEGKHYLAQIKKEHYKANHSCHAMIIGEKSEIKRSSDDGEPSGTAGIPILSVLEKQNLTNVLAVVTRYFGGIKLGTGGLIRAYSSTTSQALQGSGLVEMKVQNGLILTLTYAQYQTLSHFLEENQLCEANVSFLDQVLVTIYFNPEQENEICHNLQDFYHGKIAFQKVDSQIIAVKL